MQDMRNQKIENREQRIETRCGSRQHLSLAGVVLCLVSLVSCFFSCSEWNTDSLGQSFVPANSQVRFFTHPVYIEYSADGVRVWGPCANEIDYQVEGLDVYVTNTKTDSLALFAYGFLASQDTLGITQASLRVNSQSSYALYLDGLCLRSSDQPVIESLNDVTCHIVLPSKTQNVLYGSLSVAGELVLSGTGSLNISSTQSAIQAASLQCQYDVAVNLFSSEVHGIDLSRSAMRCTKGTWKIDAAQNAIHCPDTLLLTGGTYQGTSRQGAFFSSATILRRPTLVAAAPRPSLVMDSAFVALRYDSVQAAWQHQVDTLTLESDSLYKVFRQGSKSATLKFTPKQMLPSPYMLICHSAVLSDDTLQFEKSR